MIFFFSENKLTFFLGTLSLGYNSNDMQSSAMKTWFDAFESVLKTQTGQNTLQEGCM